MKYTIGIDFGTDSVRAIIVNTLNGEEVASSVYTYTRWAKGLYCDPSKNIYRQHPQDYIDGLIDVISSCVKNLSASQVQNICAIGIDTTGSTPAPVNDEGIPLALLEDFEDNPNAMFHLWKDHSANDMAEKINRTNSENGWDYLKYVGGYYSSEWFWAKVMKSTFLDEDVRNEAVSWVEHCDWIPFLLSGGNDIVDYKRSRCACGHKALWNETFGGLPNKFIEALGISVDLSSFQNTYTSDQLAGRLSKEWAETLGLQEGIPIAVGALDAHMGAVGGGIRTNQLSKVIGTSTCDMMVSTKESERVIKGISGQVDGSIVPDYIGYEAGQSAFGDLYKWFETITGEKEGESILEELSKEAENICDEESKEIAIDWFNGRRTPDVDNHVRGGIINLSLSSTRAHIFKALVEATCFGSKAILERMKCEGLKIDSVVALGGISQKSPYVMQNLADIMDLEIHVCGSQQTCALGSAMFASVVGGVHNNIFDAMDSMSGDYTVKYIPDASRKGYIDSKFSKYLLLGEFLESI